MVEVKKDKDGKVIAWLEHYELDNKTRFCKDGDYLWVNDFWIHKDYKRNGILNEFIQGIIPRFPKAKFLYWVRKKYSDRMTVCNIHRFGKHIKLLRKRK